MSEASDQPADDSRAGITRDRILEGALKAVSSRGVRRLAMTDVSESAHVARGTVYRYFETREILLDALMEREVGRFLDGLRESLTRSPETVEAMRSGTRYIVGYVREHPALRNMLLLEPDLVLDTLRRAMPILRARTYELFTDGHSTIASELGVPGEAAAFVADLLLRVVISEYLIPDPEPEKFEEYLNSLIDLFVANPLSTFAALGAVGERDASSQRR